jgi:hypothetical protein
LYLGQELNLVQLCTCYKARKSPKYCQMKIWSQAPSLFQSLRQEDWDMRLAWAILQDCLKRKKRPEQHVVWVFVPCEQHI